MIEVTSMAWEKRRGGKQQYYYRSGRHADGRSRRIYFGCGLVAHLAAQEDARRRKARQADRAAVKALSARLQPLDQLLDELGRQVKAEIARHLPGLGLHEHRGTWRCKRDRNTKR